jgi:lipoprotein-releasing system ATP-binding protein
LIEMQAIQSQVQAAFSVTQRVGHLLRVNELSKTFTSPAGDKIEVLRNVSFEASIGETVAIVGASGAGKSTLLHLLGGLETIDSGTVSVDGVALENCSASKLARLRNQSIGFVFQFHHLLPDLTALENVAMPLMIAGIGQKESRERARRALEAFGLQERVDHAITYLSGGEQQRIAVARALINEPVFVLADEPTGNIDAVIEEEISRSLISYAKRQQKLLIVATHNERLAARCDRVLLLKDGVLARTKHLSD